MKKKLVTGALLLAFGATAITGGTLAYFTDDEQAHNTMTIGNVQINIEENVKTEDGKSYKPFEDGKFVLYPVANDTVYKDLNKHYNKVVRTFNTSPSQDAAYIRTIVLFEKNDLLENFVGDGDSDIPGLHFAYVNAPGSGACVDGKSSRGSQSNLLDETVTINGNEYWVVVFTDAEEKAIPYDDSLHTLNAVWMDKNITQDQIAGWYNDFDGDGKYEDNKVDIIVFSQGIQSYDLTHAEAMAALGVVDQNLIDSLVNADNAVINDWVPVN